MGKYIVTGASGYIGRNLVRALSLDESNIVIAVMREKNLDNEQVFNADNIKVVFCDMKDISALPEKLADKSVDAFVHLAWEGSTGCGRADWSMQVANMHGAIEAYKVAEELGCKKFLCAGTISEKILSQVNSLNAVSQNMIYAQAKKSTYEMLSILSKNSATKMIWMQFSNVYGPDNNSGNLISYTVKTLEEDKMPEYGPCEQPYNFIYIDDLISGVIGLINGNLSKNIYFIGSKEVLLLKDFLLKIPQAMKSDLELGIGMRPDDGVKYNWEWFDISDICEETKFVPKTSFIDGIRRTYNIEAGD